MKNTEYLKLITSEHCKRPKFMKWLSESLQKYAAAEDCLQIVERSFDLDSATGVQLDVTGRTVGIDRILRFQPSGGISARLDDEKYRMIMKAKIIQNQWDGTIPEMQSLFKSVFPEYYLVIRDNQDMSMDALIVGELSQLDQELVYYGYIIPKPEGVRLNYWFFEGNIFAYDTDNEVFKGYDEGHWTALFDEFSSPLFGYDRNTGIFAGYEEGKWLESSNFNIT